MFRYSLRDLLLMQPLVVLSTGFVFLLHDLSSAIVDYLAPVFDLAEFCATCLFGQLTDQQLRIFIFHPLGDVINTIPLAIVMAMLLAARQSWLTPTAFSIPIANLLHYFFLFPWTWNVPFTPEGAVILARNSTYVILQTFCLIGLALYCLRYQSNKETNAQDSKNLSNITRKLPKFLFVCYIGACLYGWYLAISIRIWIEDWAPSIEAFYSGEA